MNNFVELLNIPGLEESRVVWAGRKLIMLALGMKALHGAVAIALMFVFGVLSASAQGQNAFENQSREKFTCPIFL